MSLETKTVKEQIIHELCKRSLELFELTAKAYIHQKLLSARDIDRIKRIIEDLKPLAEVLP